MPRPQVFKSTVINKNKLTWKILHLDLELNEPSLINFKPGQFVSVKVAEDTYRAYSIASDYKEAERIELLVEYAHEGKGSNYFKNLKIGEMVEFIGPSGKFFMKEPYPHKIVFFATGSGISPFIPMFYKLSEDRFSGDVQLNWGLRYKKDIFLLSRLTEIKKKMKSFDFTIYISQEKSTNDSMTKLGRVTDTTVYDTKESTHYYLCGNPNMVEEMENKILSKGIGIEDIIKEEFTYSK